MKKILILSTAMVWAMAAYCQTENTTAQTHATTTNIRLAEVDMQQGVAIFLDSEPVNRYKVLGTVSNSVSLSGKYQEIRNILINKAIKDYPKAQGVILHISKSGTSKADAIEFL